MITRKGPSTCTAPTSRADDGSQSPGTDITTVGIGLEDRAADSASRLVDLILGSLESELDASMLVLGGTVTRPRVRSRRRGESTGENDDRVWQ